MRLLQLDNNGGFSLTRFARDRIPPYAILSHTWGQGKDDEVTFKDITNGTGTNKRGFEKLRFCGNQAKHDDLHYFWVDTCCIDKSNNNELTTAINSMFKWYRGAARCYVYLSDVSVYTQDGRLRHLDWESAFRNSKWFTRGWTLQELLAPRVVEFYSRDHIRLGDKSSLDQTISRVTKIDADALLGRRLDQFSIEERLSWGEDRSTTEEEDKACCMLGLLDVYMPLIYGEGYTNAMNRLLREIKVYDHRMPLVNAGYPNIGNQQPDIEHHRQNIEYQPPIIEDQPQNIYIAVMSTAPTNFCYTASGVDPVITFGCREYVFFHRGHRITLVDLQGAVEIRNGKCKNFIGVVNYLSRIFGQGIRLRGLIYVHLTWSVGFTKWGKRDLSIVRSLCGRDSCKNVLILATDWKNNWNMMDPGSSTGNEVDLIRRSDLEYWVADGAKAGRYYGHRGSGLAAINEVLTMSNDTVLKIQKEIVLERMVICDTEAGQKVQEFIDAEIETQEQNYTKFEEESRKRNETWSRPLQEIAEEIIRLKKLRGELYVLFKLRFHV